MYLSKFSSNISFHANKSKPGKHPPQETVKEVNQDINQQNNHVINQDVNRGDSKQSKGHSKIEHVKRIEFAGLGSQIYSLIEVIGKLEHASVRKHIEEVATINTASLVGVAFVCGYTYNEIVELFNTFNSDNMIDHSIADLFGGQFQKLDCLYELYQTKGIYSGLKLHTWIETLICKKYGMTKMTFSQLYSKTKIGFSILMANVNTGNLESINRHSHPEIEVSSVIVASCNLGILYPPVKINNNDYSSGCIISNYNLNVFDPINEKVLGIYPITSFEQSYQVARPTDNLYHYLIALLQTIVNSRMFGNVSLDTTTLERTIPIICESSILTEVTSMINGDLTLEMKQQLLAIGGQAFDHYLSS
jgi:hypothetical protein